MAKKAVAAMQIGKAIKPATSSRFQAVWWSCSCSQYPATDTAINTASPGDIYKNFHKDGMNVLYLDGHAHLIKREAFNTEAMLYPINAPAARYAELIIATANRNY